MHGVGLCTQGIRQKMNSIKRFVVESEWFRLFVLAALVIYSYGIFFSGLNMGAADAHWYQNILHDALIQLDHGIFPVYVGQSQFNFFGSSNMRSPYYLLFAQLLHLLTFGQLDSLYIQHLTVLVSAFAAAFITYFLLTQLIPQKRWSSLLLAFLYISCPGVIGLIYYCDMYHSFMSIPYIPIAIYGIIRTHQKNDYLGYIITTIGLSLALMAHPPIAIWTMGVCFYIYCLRIIFLRKGLIGLLIVPCLLVILNLWQFVSMQTLGLRDYLSDQPHYVDWIMKTIKNDIPGVFLPLGWSSEQAITPFLQLGYSFWIIVLVGLIIALRPACHFLIRALVACVLLLLILLYPVPLVTPFLWSLTPKALRTLTLWPMQRFYIILAVLTSFIGALIISKISLISGALIKRLLTCFLVLVFSWNMYQTFYFINYGQKVVQSTSNFWLFPENMFFMANGLLPIHNNITITHYDPKLKNLLLNEQQNPVEGYNNEQQVINECIKHLTTFSQASMTKIAQSFPINLISSTPQHILKINSPTDNRLFLCLKTTLNNTGINLAVIKPQNGTNTSLNARTDANLSYGLSTQIVSIPIFHSIMDELNVYASVTPRENLKPNEPSLVSIQSYGLISYDPDKLPIRITSFTPYKANVETQIDNTYLQIFKEYFPGYKAKVDGKDVSVLESKTERMVMIPLTNKGVHQIELYYEGTPLMKFTFYISAFAWANVFMFFVVLGYRKYIVFKLSKTAFVFSDQGHY
jgi:hypothetical protein